MSDLLDRVPKRGNMGLIAVLVIFLCAACTGDAVSEAPIDSEPTARPGDSHLNPLNIPPVISFEPDISGRLALGESVVITVIERNGELRNFVRYEVVHQNEPVTYAGSVTADGTYTAPLILPDPPEVRVRMYYQRAGSDGLSLLGVPIELVASPQR